MELYLYLEIFQIGLETNLVKHGKLLKMCLVQEEKYLME